MGKRLCKNCDFVGSGALPGHGWVEALLWLCYLVPGAIYSIWRRGRGAYVCPRCHAPYMIPLPPGHNGGSAAQQPGLRDGSEAPRATLPSPKAGILNRDLPNWAILVLAGVVAMLTVMVVKSATRSSHVKNEGYHADDSAAATVNALNTWWQEFTYSPPVVKPGTITPAHTIISTKGRVYKVPKHIQTKQEAKDETENDRYMDRKRNLVRGFSVTGHTVTVRTNLARNTNDLRDAQELCRNLGAFAWGIPYRHFALENINVIGSDGELLSSRAGFLGTVQ